MGKILTVKGISKNYKIGNTQVHALKSTTLDINKGEIVVVIGKSGSGKSTFLNILGGLIVPDSGEVLLDGKNLYKLGEKERAKIRNQKCGFIYQSFNLINELSVINNIRLPFDIAGKPYDTKRERELLAILDLFLLLVQRGKQIVVMIGYITHQLLRFFIAASAIGVGTDVAIEQFFKDRSHL